MSIVETNSIKIMKFLIKAVIFMKMCQIVLRAGYPTLLPL